MLKLVRSQSQTKKWRNSQPWYRNGKRNECEMFQKHQLEAIQANLKLAAASQAPGVQSKQSAGTAASATSHALVAHANDTTLSTQNVLLLAWHTAFYWPRAHAYQGLKK